MDKNILNTLFPAEVVALTVYGESRGEPVEGQIAVANVIYNRFRDNPTKYKTIFDVCLEPKQFSCWNENDPNYPNLLRMAYSINNNKPLNDRYLKQAEFIAQGVASNNLLDNTRRSHYYITTHLFETNRPHWARAPINTKEIGNHIFFNV